MMDQSCLLAMQIGSITGTLSARVATDGNLPSLMDRTRPHRCCGGQASKWCTFNDTREGLKRRRQKEKDVHSRKKDDHKLRSNDRQEERQYKTCSIGSYCISLGILRSSPVASITLPFSLVRQMDRQKTKD
ncbi:hypothetical protein ElyMa_005374300 [Elysia marginata]|uniref:Uncharacterized protein n=1 Tax=Elysia marginata TaxID=1093978 RepID=A0AAV4ED34_9GAST|nr:hypothetical protein ElyMa_005374300 [Elysia marginata]